MRLNNWSIAASYDMAPIAELPVLEIVSTAHILSDLTLGLGKVVHDYLAPTARQPTRSREKAHAP
jgi:acetoacetate decarboxylase